MAAFQVGLRAFNLPRGLCSSSARTFAPSAVRAFSTSSAFHLQQQRNVTIEAYSDKQNLELLNKQRALRPNSPHFTIYQPQLSWYSSIAHRITGVGLSVGLYGLAIGYVALPLVGLPFESQSIVNLVSALPSSIKYLGKFIASGTFWYHSFNGMRHLAWDTVSLMSLKSAWAAGYTVIGLSVVMATITTFFL